MGAGVYEPSASAAIGMVLAAKDDRLPDCVTRPEPVWADVPVTEEAEEEPMMVEEPFFVPDATFNEGEQGSLGLEEQVPVEAAPEKPAKPKKVKKERVRKPAEPRKETPTIHWFKTIGNTLKTGVLSFYDEMTREEENENQKKEEE